MYEKIINKIAEIMEISQDTIKERDNLFDDIGMDSLQMVGLILDLEEEFNLEIDFEEIDFEEIITVKSFCEFIGNLENGK